MGRNRPAMETGKRKVAVMIFKEVLNKSPWIVQRPHSIVQFLFCLQNQRPVAIANQSAIPEIKRKLKQPV